MTEQEVRKAIKARPYFLKGPAAWAGQWGALVFDPGVEEGADVEIETRSGKQFTDRVGYVLYRDPSGGYAVCTLVGNQE